jgi:hypothetical protein
MHIVCFFKDGGSPGGKPTVRTFVSSSFALLLLVRTTTISSTSVSDSTYLSPLMLNITGAVVSSYSRPVLVVLAQTYYYVSSLPVCLLYYSPAIVRQAVRTPDKWIRLRETTVIVTSSTTRSCQDSLARVRLPFWAKWPNKEWRSKVCPVYAASWHP